MVVMAVCGYVLKAGLPVPELALYGQRAIGEELHRAVDGRVPYARGLSSDFFKEFVQAYVGVGPEEGFGYEVALSG